MFEKDTSHFRKCRKNIILYILNFTLFFIGAFEVGGAVYLLLAGAKSSFVFTTDVLGNDREIRQILILGAVLVLLSLLGCIGVRRERKCMLWSYGFNFPLLIVFQAVSMGRINVYGEHSEPIFGSMWKGLNSESVINIEETFDCCSFNGADTESTWAVDVAKWTNCTTRYSQDTETCWEKFGSVIGDIYRNLKHILELLLALQIIIYFSTRYFMHSISPTEVYGDVVRPSSAYWGQRESHDI